MKQKHFKRSIQFKFLLLRLFIAGVIILVSAANIYFVQRIAEDSSYVIENHVPLLQSVQKAHSAALSAGLNASTLLNAQDRHTETAQDSNAYLISYRTVLQEVATTLSTVKTLSPEGAQRVQEIETLLSAFEKDFQEAYAARAQAKLLEGTGTEEELAVHQQALLLQEQTLSHLKPLTALFNEWEDELVREIDGSITLVGESNQSNQILITLISLLAILITLFVGLLFSNRTIVRPLEELTDTAEEMASGKLSKRVEIYSRDEIGKLAYTFNKMAARLEASYDDLEKIVSEKTQALEKVLDQFESKNEDLEKSQMATINLLEDLEVEKKAVEERVRLRTLELEREKNKLLQVTSNMRGSGILLDDKHEVVFVNEAAYEMLGLKKDNLELVLGSFLSHFGDEIRTYFKRCVEGETFHVPEIEGNGHVYEIFFHHLRNGSETAGFFILIFDITDSKLLERSKSELVAVASHQLRTPLTAMRGNVEMLIDESFGPLNKEQHELLEDIDVSTIRLIAMVNEMLDITKIERGNLELSMEKINIAEVITSVVADLQAYAERHEFTINHEVPSDIYIDADRVRLRQIFQNLIDNAIKYSSHPGQLDIAATMKGDMIEIAFKDNGIGIPKNEQSKLFDRFYRASNTAKSASSGSGLGLYIVKALAQQFGGDITFESEENKGTTFFVTLPPSQNNS